MQRRSFLKAGASLAASIAHPAARPGALAAEPNAASTVAGSYPRSFPEGFRWGTATASYQVEGAVQEEGRGPSIWDRFSQTPVNTHNGDTGDVADDHFHRYKEDIALMKSLGVNSYRFSIAWPRVFPKGNGQPNPNGLDFYNRLLDELQNAGIEPFCTLYHWDLPLALQDKWGGWQSKDTAKAFADYCGYTAGKLSSRISNFMTMNEMSAFVHGGYRDGHFAPGLRLGPGAVAAISHNVVLAHGMAVRAIRAAGNSSIKVGLASNAVSTTPLIETEDHIAATRIAFREENAAFLTVLMEGKYTEAYLQGLAADAPKYTTEELALIGSPLDYLGLNVSSARAPPSAAVRASHSGESWHNSPKPDRNCLAPKPQFRPDPCSPAPQATGPGARGRRDWHRRPSPEN